MVKKRYENSEDGEIKRFVKIFCRRSRRLLFGSPVEEEEHLHHQRKNGLGITVARPKKTVRTVVKKHTDILHCMIIN